MNLLNKWPQLTVALVLICVLAACESDAQRIRTINEDEQTQTLADSGSLVPTPTPLSAAIHSTEIQDGDCINSTIETGLEVDTVVIVPCSGAWQYRALNALTVPDSDNYPGEDSFAQLANERCDRRFTEFLFPTHESWGLRDRTVNCLQESFGLSVSDRPKLDHLVVRLNVGECYRDAPETGGLLVELVDCSGSWQYRVLNALTVPDSDNYPGEDSFAQLANERCDRRFTEFLFPTHESWGLRDRTVNCLQESFGLSVSDRPKLDHLVVRLNVGECYRDAPETGGLLVELVDCSGSWQYRVLNALTVPNSDNYPGEDSFAQLANERCDRRFTEFLFPTHESWGLRNRTVNCLQESFGLSVSDRPKLDHLVNTDRLNVRECYRNAPETGGLLVELVDCSSDWELQVVGIFFVPVNGAFPGNAYFQDQAGQNCQTPSDVFYAPSDESWRLGDRKVVCARRP